MTLQEYLEKTKILHDDLIMAKNLCILLINEGIVKRISQDINEEKRNFTIDIIQLQNIKASLSDAIKYTTAINERK